jgi:hypothetical protein
LERFSYIHTLSERALRVYEDYAEVRAGFDELKILRSGRTAYDYLDMLACFVESSGKSPKDLVKLSSGETYDVLRKWALSELRKGSPYHWNTLECCQKLLQISWS